MDPSRAGERRPLGSASAGTTWVKRITYLIVDCFDVHLSNLDVAAIYEAPVSSINTLALEIGWCVTVAQTAAVTGATAQDLNRCVAACGLGEGDRQSGGAGTGELRRQPDHESRVSAETRVLDGMSFVDGRNPDSASTSCKIGPPNVST